MTPFGVLTSAAAVLDLANVDTDQIIPARFLRKPRASGYHSYLFHDLRRNPDGSAREDFALDRPAARGARILVTGPNFGSGTSREGAVYALVDAGFRAIVAPSFGDIFAANALRNGLLPVVVPPDTARDLVGTLSARPDTVLTIDLDAQRLSGGGTEIDFAIDPFRRECLLKGIDEIDLTLQYRDAIEAFRRDYWATAPWSRPRAGIESPGDSEA